MTDNQPNRSSHPLTEPGRYPLDLTGPHSHTLDRQLGVGSLSIGPPALRKKAELHVEPDAPIQWSVFDAFATPAGSPWPRYLHYTGNDAGFVEWAWKRPVEQISWTPLFQADKTVDASRSILHSLHIKLGSSSSGRLHLVLPEKAVRLSVSGDLARFTATGTLPTSLALVPHLDRRASCQPYALPDMGDLQGVTSLTLQSSPLGQPISLDGLDRFPHLEELSLWGSFSDLDALTRLPQLTALELRFMPDLAGLPALDTWPQLERFIAFNVEESNGKRLRQQMKARAKTRPWADYASVSQLRKPEWWASEFGRPFAAWPKRLAQLANEAYNTAEAALAEARSLADAEAAITAFTGRFNALKGIETTEREDLGEAVWQLSQSAQPGGEAIPEEMAQGWFDAARDY
jgi:hypothetical protein